MTDFEMVLQVVTDDGTRLRRRFEVSAGHLIEEDELPDEIDRALTEFAEEVRTALGGGGPEAIDRLQSVRVTLDRLS